ncbi:CDK5RAP3-like protein [Babesia microti strain RI]|uniref:CDK5RAP3-like protein n=1 Tax=Babesia microti (strain RI) TaxID=1133968 RepID=A0A1R4AC33_BABMR|nr:CDK5RAP3-like protein [Babesia microti strain RI]SJK86572.1 CDK5RAP3-like protein [Babesia microti strain RI]|eukprot:XP_012649302.2 CDK5RAP3-like protein [Babesia microti strain RI]
MELLDLHYDSLVNWFVSHGKLDNDCRRCFIGMESETKQLIDDIKSTSAAVTEYINKYYDKDAVSYYHFTKIIEILENDERAKQKNILGQCTFEPLYNSRKLLSKYNKNRLYLVAYAEILKRNVKYYIPFLRSSIKNSQKQIDNLLKKQVDIADQVDNLYKKLKVRLSEYKLNIDNFTSQSSRDNLFDTIKINYIYLADEYLSQTFSELLVLIKNDIFPITKMFTDVVNERNFDKNLVDFTNITHLINFDTPIDSNLDVYFQINKDKLLGEIKELLTFIVQIKSQYEMSVLPQNILKIFAGTNFENCINSLNKSIELMNGRKTIEMMQIKCNPEYRNQCASKEIDLWNKYFNIKDLGYKTNNRIKEMGDEVQQLTTKLEKLRDETREITKVVESVAQEMTGLTVKIIGTNI